MAGVTKVNGYVHEDQFYGRELMIINIAGMPAAPSADPEGRVKWPELDEATQAIETRVTVSAVGAFTTGDTEVNMIIEGHDYSDKAAVLTELSTLTGYTVTEVAL